MLVLVLLMFGIAFAVCPPEKHLVDLELSAHTVDKQGSLYRRADVLLFIPVEKRKHDYKAPSPEAG